MQYPLSGSVNLDFCRWFENLNLHYKGRIHVYIYIYKYWGSYIYEFTVCIWFFGPSHRILPNMHFYSSSESATCAAHPGTLFDPNVSSQAISHREPTEKSEASSWWVAPWILSGGRDARMQGRAGPLYGYEWIEGSLHPASHRKTI